MFVSSQVSDINNRDDQFSWKSNRSNNNIVGSYIQESASFQQQANDIKNTIKNRKNASIADCLGLGHQQIQLGSSSERVDILSQQRCPVHDENQNIQNRVINQSVRFADYSYENEPLVVVEKSSRQIKKNQYEGELRNLRKANANLENKLSDIKDFNYDMKQSLKKVSNSTTDIQKNSTIQKQPHTSTSIVNSRQTLGAVPLNVNILNQSNNQQQQAFQVPNLFDNKKMLSSMVESVSVNARKEALQQQEDGDEVREMKNQRDYEDQKRVQTVNDLEKENTKLKNKAIRSHYETEEYEDKIKDLENKKTQQHKDIKSKQKDLKAKEHDFSTLINKKAKVESDITSQRLILKDREAEITRNNDKLKLNANERQKTLRDHELHVQKRNIAQLDFEKVRQDRDRIMEEMERRQVEANDKYNDLQQKYLNSQNDVQALDREITILENFIEEEKKEIQKLKMQNKILKDKEDDMSTFERKLRKKEKNILSLESELELVRREKKIEIVEKIIEKPVVVEKPVVIEKEVVIKEEVKVDEPLEKELAILREELSVLDNGLKEKTSESLYWKKRFQDSELQGKHNVGSIQESFNCERSNMRIHYEKGVEEISTLQAKLNALLAEIHTLSNINISKNREVQDQLHHLINNNQSLENILVANSHNSIPVSVQLPVSSRYVSYH